MKQRSLSDVGFSSSGRSACSNKQVMSGLCASHPVTLTASNFTDAHLINHMPPITHVALTASNSTEAQMTTQHLLTMPGQDLCETCYFIKDFTVVFLNCQHLQETGNIYEKQANFNSLPFSIVNIYEKWAMSMRNRLKQKKLPCHFLHCQHLSKRGNIYEKQATSIIITTAVNFSFNSFFVSSEQAATTSWYTGCLLWLKVTPLIMTMHSETTPL